MSTSRSRVRKTRRAPADAFGMSRRGTWRGPPPFAGELYERGSMSPEEGEEDECWTLTILHHLVIDTADEDDEDPDLPTNAQFNEHMRACSTPAELREPLREFLRDMRIVRASTDDRRVWYARAHRKYSAFVKTYGYPKASRTASKPLTLHRVKTVVRLLRSIGISQDNDERSLRQADDIDEEYDDTYTKSLESKLAAAVQDWPRPARLRIELMLRSGYARARFYKIEPDDWYGINSAVNDIARTLLKLSRGVKSNPTRRKATRAAGTRRRTRRSRR